MVYYSGVGFATARHFHTGCNEVGIMVWLIWTAEGYVCERGRSMLAADAMTWDDLETAKWEATRQNGQLIGYRPELDCTR